MESEKQRTERETPPQQPGSSWKLIIDPALTNGLYKVYRFDGQHFNLPVEDLGLFPVDTVRDPRICRLWSKSRNTDLSVPRFKLDNWYVGPVPPKEVTFSKLNDNVRETFLTDMCHKYGNIDEVEIFYNPKNKKHLGIAKVIFDTVKAAKDAVQHLHQTSVMGNIIHVEVDPKGERRARYLQLLVNGLYTPWTLPVGSSDQALQSLIDSLLGGAATQQLSIACSPTSIATPLSLDTAYSSIWQDTPCSFGLTPHSQGTPRTPCLTATPLSQDSCYSSLQATPVLQGEPSTHSVHKPPRQELWHRKPARHHRGLRTVSNINLILKHCQQQAPQLFSDRKQTNKQQLAVWSGDPQSPACDERKTPFVPVSPVEECVDTFHSTSSGLTENCSSFTILSINVPPDKHTTGAPPPDDYQAAGESLDSRIESLLTNSQITDRSYLDGETLDGLALSPDSPVSSFSESNPTFSEESQFCTQASRGSFAHSRHHTEVVHASPALTVENEEDETVQAVSFLTRNLESPSPSDALHFETKAYESDKTEAERLQSQCSTENHSVSRDKEHSDDRLSGAPRPSSGSFSSSTSQHFTPKAPPAASPGCPRPSLAPFPFPIPPFPSSVPPVPLCLPNGAILIPPPGWVPPHGRHTGIPIPPPPIPPSPSVAPPPTFLRPPPPLSVPPSVPPPVHAYPSSMQPAGPLDKVDPPRQSSAPLSFPRPPWPALPLPGFNPFMPPPNYVPLQENPHKVTVEKVLEVLMDELKSIIKRDITRRMIEGVAFKAFENWWDSQEKNAKVHSLKSGAAFVKERSKFVNPLSRIGEPFKKPPLPSFKVKRKRPEDAENQTPSCDETSDSKLGAEILKPASETAKRRHARPLELDSDDDDEGKEGGKTQQDEEKTSEIEDVPVADSLQIPPDRKKDEEDDDLSDAEEERKSSQRQMEDEPGQGPDGAQHSESETFSESSLSEESEYSSDFDTSDWFSSESFEDSSSYLSTEDEGLEEDDESGRSRDCYVISSDEDAMELEDPLTPSAPLTPDPGLQDWADLLQRKVTEENQYLSHQPHTCDLDNVMELQSSEPQDLQPPSPRGLTGVEPCHDVEMESPEWSLEFQESIENLRPLTPTGCLLDSEPEVLVKTKSASPAVEEVERPQTPGKGITVNLGSEESYEAGDILSSGGSELVSPPSDLLAVLCPSSQERPRTPGREERCAWTHYNGCGTIPSTPGRDIVSSEGSPVGPHLSSPPPVLPPSSNPYSTAPKTPGRDIKLPRRVTAHKRKRQTKHSSLPWISNCFHPGSPVAVSSPCSLSDSSSDAAEGHDGWRSSCVRTKPLQGLENMPGIFDEEKYLLRRRHWTRLKRRRRARHRHRSFKRFTDSPFSDSRPHRWRSLWQEKRILHRIWKEGLDEEDARLLQCVYERLQEQDNGTGWLSDTLWIPHPLVTENTEEQARWQPRHRSGSARSEGFYKISKSDKMTYLSHTRSPSELPSTSAQGSCIPPQQSTWLRAGSEFRSEQRRLLSSFSCDSDLVKFNQLKFRKKRIRFSRSHIHEWGLFAMEPIAADEMVIEYVGQIIRQVIADTREQRYEEEGIGNSYMFRVDEDTIIDATKLGNLSRFINHSCNPNCYAKIITVESQKKIVIYSRQPISINEEITYDYKFPIEEVKIPCLCGEDSCRGFLN